MNQGKTILLVEDNLDNQLVAQVMIKKAGYDVVTVEDGLQAVNYLKEKADRICLVLMDIQMPVMDGIEATRQIRALTHSPASRLPIVAVTAFADSENRTACEESGMNSFLAKPYTFDKLSRAIKDILD
jgi:CheY-like chemotaxis protein